MKATFTPLGISIVLFFFSIHAQAQIFVKADATGTNNGFSWAMPLSSTKTVLDNSTLSISPNPVEAYTTLSLDNEWAGEVEVRILNAQGQIVHSKTYHKAPGAAMCFLELDHLESGTYNLFLSHGKSVILKKLVKK